MSTGTKITPLSNNLRFLRKKMGLSQTGLAEALGIRRSNIAAYESKNVEPRLKVLIDISDFFNQDLRTLIATYLNDDNWEQYQNTKQPKRAISALNLDAHPEIKEFKEKSVKISKVLEGFKAFYKFKKEKLKKEGGHEVEGLMHDIENFISLMEHLLQYNDSIIQALSSSEDE